MVDNTSGLEKLWGQKKRLIGHTRATEVYNRSRRPTENEPDARKPARLRSRSQSRFSSSQTPINRRSHPNTNLLSLGHERQICPTRRTSSSALRPLGRRPPKPCRLRRPTPQQRKLVIANHDALPAIRRKRPTSTSSLNAITPCVDAITAQQYNRLTLSEHDLHSPTAISVLYLRHLRESPSRNT
jgi:hypothetical protein